MTIQVVTPPKYDEPEMAPQREDFALLHQLAG